MKKKCTISAALFLMGVLPAWGDGGNTYVQTNLVSSDAAFSPQILAPSMIDAWGIALRPPGAGGHIWISNAFGGFSSEYIGDVNGVPLHQDGLQNVIIDTAGFADHGVAFVTGQVYNAASDLPGQAVEFAVSGQAHDLTTNPATPLGTITGAAKFIFVTEDGTINAWRSNTAAAMDTAPVVVDYTKTSSFYPYTANSVFSGVAMTAHAVPLGDQGNTVVGNHLFAADFRNNAIQVFNNQWQDVTSTYHFVTPATVGDLHPFNIMDFSGHLFVAYAKWNPDGDEGFEDDPGFGHLVEYNEDGTLVKDFNSGPLSADDGGRLNSPWGMAIAPSTFGAFSNDVLVANFGDGTIAAFNPVTGNFIDNLRDSQGDVISIDGLWGLTFGNGVSLGDANALYFTAGPHAEQDALFGKLAVAAPEPGSLAFAAIGMASLLARRHAKRSEAR